MIEKENKVLGWLVVTGGLALLLGVTIFSMQSVDQPKVRAGEESLKEKEGGQEKVSKTIGEQLATYSNEVAGFQFSYPSQWGDVQERQLRAKPGEAPPTRGEAIAISFTVNEAVYIEATTSDFWTYAAKNAYRGNAELASVCERPEIIERKNLEEDVIPRSRYWAIGYCDNLGGNSYYEVLMSSPPAGDPILYQIEQVAYFNLGGSGYTSLAIFNTLESGGELSTRDEAEDVAHEKLQLILNSVSNESSNQAGQFEELVSSVKIK